MGKPEIYDEIAMRMATLPERYGDTAFTDRRRVTSLISDYVPSAKRELKILSTALNDGVIETLQGVRPEQVRIEIDRLSKRLDDIHGIQPALARMVVSACAYALGRGPLPSEYAKTLQPGEKPTVPLHASTTGDSWIGVTEPATARQQPAQRPAASPSSQSGVHAQPRPVAQPPHTQQPPHHSQHTNWQQPEPQKKRGSRVWQIVKTAFATFGILMFGLLLLGYLVS